MQDHRHQARTQAGPRPEEIHQIDRPHVRDAGPVQPNGEEEEPQGEANEGDESGGPAGPFFTGAVHGVVSLADVASLGTEPTESPTSLPVPPPTLALFPVRLLR